MIDSPDSEIVFTWVDDYIGRIRPHFEVRPADELLIVMPNKAVRLNRSGLAILKFLKDGGGIDSVLGKIGPDAQRRRELHYFLCDFRSLMTGCLREGTGRKAVETVPPRPYFSELPVLSELALTYRCNLRCRFCYAACSCRAAEGGEELSTADVKRLLGIIRREAQVPSISFTGGEPMLREDIEELIAAAGEAGLRTNLITNGTRVTPARAAAMKAAGLASAQVSLEGPTAAVHDALTSVPGSFEQTLAGLAALRQAGVHVHTNTTINAMNAASLEALVDFVADLGMERLSANLVIPSGSAADLSIQVTYTQVGEHVEAMRRRARARGVEFMWYSPTPLCLFNPLARGLGNKSCAACDGLLSISPRGDVLPCSSYPQPVGNLLTEPFERVWRGARSEFHRLKRHAPPQCIECGEFHTCTGACPLYWAAMGTAEIEGRAYAPA